MLPEVLHGAHIRIIGAGALGVIVGYELMKLGAHPVLFEAGQFGGRRRARAFEGAKGVIA